MFRSLDFFAPMNGTIFIFSLIPYSYYLHADHSYKSPTSCTDPFPFASFLTEDGTFASDMVETRRDS